MRLLLAAFVCLCPIAAWAQPGGGVATGAVSNSTVTATGSTTPRTLADSSAHCDPGSANCSWLDVKNFGAKADGQGYTDGTVSASSTAFSSALATFTAADVGKTIAIDGAGAAGSYLSTTIAGFVDAHDITLAAPASTATPYFFVTSAAPSTAQSGAGSYAPADTVTLTGGTAATQAVLTVTATQFVSATANAAGSGGTTGACILTGTTGTSLSGLGFLQINATISGGAISAIGSVVNAGVYTVNPTSLTAEPVTSNCGLTGATLTLKMGVANATVTTQGNYSATPSNPVSQGATSGSGTGATFTLVKLTAGAFRYGTDNAPAFNRAIAAANNTAAGLIPVIYIPAGNYAIKSPALTTLLRVPATVSGDGSLKSIVWPDPSYSGAIFSWSECWNGVSFPTSGNSVNLSGINSGPTIRGITISGDRSATSEQDAFTFFDRNQFVLMDDVQVYYLNGRAIYTGVLLNSTESYVWESHFYNLRFLNDGNATAPVWDINSLGVNQAANEVVANMVEIFGPYGTGLSIQDNASIQSASFNFDELRVEGLQNNGPGISVDLITIGNTAATAAVHDVFFTNLKLLNPYLGKASFRTTAASAGTKPFNIRISTGLLFGGAGNPGAGIAIDAGSNESFLLTNVSGVGTQISVGSSALTAKPIFFDGLTNEPNWTWNVDATAAPYVHYPFAKSGNPTTGGLNVQTLTGTSGTITQLAGANYIALELWGAGGTGGNGPSLGAAGSGSGGGGGGGGFHLRWGPYLWSSLGATSCNYAISAPSGATVGGGTASVTCNSVVVAQAGGGGGGGNGSATATSGGGGGATALGWPGGTTTGGASGFGGGSGGTGVIGTNGPGDGGGGGGGTGTTGVATAGAVSVTGGAGGGSGGGCSAGSTAVGAAGGITSGRVGGTAGGNPGVSGSAGSGTGGGGSGSTTSGTAAAGGAGGFPGGGGAGAGAGCNGTGTGGTGGTGGGGEIIVSQW